jgi:hypothetical protein
VDPAAERDALTHARDRATALLWRGVGALAAMIPVMLVGGLAVAFGGRRNEMVISLGMGGLGIGCALLGFGMLFVGMRRLVRINRALHALDHGTLPEARLVR